MKTLGIFFALALSANFIFAQTNRCAFDGEHQRHLADDPAFKSAVDEIEKNYQEMLSRGSIRSSSTIKTIPVVVHVVYRIASQNISDAQIQSQIDVLNEDYRHLNADADSSGADIEVEFCLATKDPSGQDTNGITRTSTTITSFSNIDDIKYTSTGGIDAWPTNKYLNIWVGNLGGGVLGTGTFPGTTGDPEDGVVVQYNAFGRTGTLQPTYNKGRTCTHEAGHWFSLFHTFQGCCSGTSSATCATQGDLVCDTPPTNGNGTGSNCENFGCSATSNPNQNTCTETPVNLKDMPENFMDYSDDACMWKFTPGQKTRMQNGLSAPARFNHWQTLNLLSTGCYSTTGMSEKNISYNEYLNLSPNPTSGITNIQFKIAKKGFMKISVYDMLGREVAVVLNEEKEKGAYDISWSLYKNILNAGGLYFVKMETEEKVLTQKLLLVR